MVDGVSRYAAWRERADAIEREGLKRTLRALVPVGPTRAALPDGRVCDLFSSNDYLGLAEHPAIRAAMASGGAGAARLISGNRPGHDALEDALGAWMGRPVTLFGSGYLANLAVFTALFGAGDHVASDALNHASIIDGLRLSRCARTVLRHGSAAVPTGANAVAVEGLYSMDGDFAPVVELAAAPGAPLLVVDEAHAVGCIGPEGRGVAALAGVTPDVVVGTLGKAFGAAGAFVVGPPEVRDVLVSSARPFIYTTGMPEGLALAALAGLRLATDERRERLAARVQRLRAGLAQVGGLAGGVAHIVPIRTGPRTMELAGALLERGFLVGGVRYPTVARGDERLRVTVSAEHTDDQVDRLVASLGALLPRSE